MKKTDINLSIPEAEELCRLYMDCRLSVLEEKELEYVLSQLPYSTPEIETTRAIMGIVVRNVPSAARKDSRSWFRRHVWMAAASVIAIFAVALGIILNTVNRTTEYEAFANGRILDLDQARVQAIQQSKNADDIINIMDVMILQQQTQYENFKKNLALYP